MLVQRIPDWRFMDYHRVECNCIRRCELKNFLVILITFVFAIVDPARLSVGNEPTSLPSANNLDLGRPSPLPMPSQTPIEAYERELYRFLNDRQYVALGWKVDKRVRDTGPYIKGQYFGTHPAVRMYYSPEIIKWLLNGRRDAIPDGAMIIKEQFQEPAARHEGKTEEEIWASLKSWTVMVKDSKGSYDGWFWSNPGKGRDPVNEHETGYPHPESGFGHYCVRCHASATSSGQIQEYSFASLRNIQGFPGEPVLFRVDDSWQVEPTSEPSSSESNSEKVGESEATATTDLPASVATASAENDSGQVETAEVSPGNHPACIYLPGAKACVPQLSQEFLELFPSIPRQDRSSVLKIPSVSYDWAVRAPRDKVAGQGFVTSNQCMNCHAALSSELGPSMIHYTTDQHGYGKPGWDYSPYGEWRWTPMGLAGRDPIFYAQMELEQALMQRDFGSDTQLLADIQSGLTETCLRRHGVMGKHQWDMDHNSSHSSLHSPFSLEKVYATAGRHEMPGDNHSHYGALARDGISCTVCHRMQPRAQPESDQRSALQFFLETSITGNMTFGPTNELYGPFKDNEIAAYAMEHAIGFTPKHNTYLKSSQMCGTCHTISLPVVDKPLQEGASVGELAQSQPLELFRKFKHHVEQATYLEWLNSDYENEYNTNNSQGKSCQDCHMSRQLIDPERGIALKRLKTRMAIIQDLTYPEAENLAPHEKLNVRIREEGFSRHNFSGLNAFLLEMFRQFEDILGVPRQDYMTGAEQIDYSITNIVQNARENTADLKLESRIKGNQLAARVTLVNKAGHRFPSGVGFRRAFLELLVLDESKQGSEAIVWSSGRTNAQGVLIGPDGLPLATEFFEPSQNNGQPQYQPHHTVITSGQQVQIYEHLFKDAQHQFTTSFVRGYEMIKDNRLLPKGWSREGRHPELKGEFLAATLPIGAAMEDPKYLDGSGSDETIYRIQIPEGVDPERLVVKATLYYQAIPPYFLKALFEGAPDGPATRRLHYLCSNLRLEGTPIEDWKLRLVSQQVTPER